MKYQLFVKELFGGRKKLISSTLLTFIIYILVAFQIVFNTQSSYNSALPDLMFTGQQGNKILFEKYNSINKDFKRELENEMKESIQSYEFVERNIITVQKENSLENITYSIFGCEHLFFKEKLYDQLKEGYLPAANKFEVVVGGYMAKSFDIKIGDIITTKTVKLNNLGDVGMVLDLSGEFIEIEYKVVGVLDFTDSIFDYSILLDKDTQPDNPPNVVWSYFTNDNSKNIYLQKLVNSNTDIFYRNRISGVSEVYRNINHGLLEQILKVGYTFIFVIILALFMVSYVVKGTTKKLGILKALGMSNKYIYKCYFGGVALIQLIALLLSYLTMNVITNKMNTIVSDSYGYDVSIYGVNLNAYLLATIMFVLVVTSMLGIISYKITKISPKVAILS